MYFVSKITILLFITTTILLSGSCNEKYNRKDKLVLNPVELIDLIRQEQSNKGAVTSDPYLYKYKEANEITSNLNAIQELATTTVEEFKDEDKVMSRKVWSRWGKWGECSVTCGAGTVRRVRVCVAGRCAPREREEQRRPCARAPCAPGRDVSPDDLHYLDK